MSKGLFVVIDGIDGSGKETQTDLLTKRLVAMGYPTESISFPRYKANFNGKFLWDCLKENKHGNFLAVDPYVASYPYAADRFESSELIRSCLEKGSNMISDRYVSSNQIHQGGKIHDPVAREEFLLWLDQLEFEAPFNNPRPDIIVYLHAPVALSLRKIKERAMKDGATPDQAESSAEHLVDSQKSALSIFATRDNWIKINCEMDGSEEEMRAREDINEEIFQKIEPIILKARAIKSK